MSPPESKTGARPWWILLTFVVVAGVFFAVSHDLSFSLRDKFDKDADSFATALAEGNPTRRAAFVVLGLFGVAALIRRSRERFRLTGLLACLVFGLSIWAISSMTWSVDAGYTMKKTVVLAMLLVGAGAVATRLELRGIVWLALLMSGIYLAIGFAAEFVLGTFNPGSDGYRFVGTIHPNGQGQNCALFVLAAITASKLAPRWRMRLLACSGVGLIFLALTGSRAALAATIAAILVSSYLAWSGRRRFWILGAGVVVACTMFLVIGESLAPALRTGILLGRQETTDLNGRVQIWGACLEQTEGHALLGHGYQSFWAQQNVYDVSARLGWGSNSCHSAYVDLLLDLGLIGLLLYLAILGIATWRCFLYGRATGEPAFGFLGAVLVLCAAVGLMESTIVFYPQPLAFVALVVVLRLAFQMPPPLRHREVPGVRRTFVRRRGALLPGRS